MKLSKTAATASTVSPIIVMPPAGFRNLCLALMIPVNKFVINSKYYLLLVSIMMIRSRRRRWRKTTKLLEIRWVTMVVMVALVWKGTMWTGTCFSGRWWEKSREINTDTREISGKDKEYNFRNFLNLPGHTLIHMYTRISEIVRKRNATPAHRLMFLCITLNLSVWFLVHILWLHKRF